MSTRNVGRDYEYKRGKAHKLIRASLHNTAQVTTNIHAHGLHVVSSGVGGDMLTVVRLFVHGKFPLIILVSFIGTVYYIMEQVSNRQPVVHKEFIVIEENVTLFHSWAWNKMTHYCKISRNFSTTFTIMSSYFIIAIIMCYIFLASLTVQKKE